VVVGITKAGGLGFAQAVCLSLADVGGLNFTKADCLFSFVMSGVVMFSFEGGLGSDQK
jgi:hypothetical protein